MTDAGNHHVGLGARATHGFALSLKCRSEPSCTAIELENGQSVAVVCQLGEAASKVLSPATLRQAGDSVGDLHHRHGSRRECLCVLLIEPYGQGRVDAWPHQFGEDVGVENDQRGLTRLGRQAAAHGFALIPAEALRDRRRVHGRRGLRLGEEGSARCIPRTACVRMVRASSSMERPARAARMRSASLTSSSSRRIVRVAIVTASHVATDAVNECIAVTAIS